MLVVVPHLWVADQEHLFSRVLVDRLSEHMNHESLGFLIAISPGKTLSVIWTQHSNINVAPDVRCHISGKTGGPTLDQKEYTTTHEYGDDLIWFWAYQWQSKWPPKTCHRKHWSQGLINWKSLSSRYIHTYNMYWFHISTSDPYDETQGQAWYVQFVSLSYPYNWNLKM